MATNNDLTGQVFGQLTVTAAASNDKHGDKRWQVRCSCNTLLEVPAKRLRNGAVTHCGCAKKSSAKKSSAKKSSEKVGIQVTRSPELEALELCHDFPQLRAKYRVILPAIDAYTARVEELSNLPFEQHTPELLAELVARLCVLHGAQSEMPLIHGSDDEKFRYRGIIHAAQNARDRWTFDPLKDL